jgi:DNA-binding NarL/FixJ family response regulator
MLERDVFICLIDSHNLTQHSLRLALENVEPSIDISAFRSVEDCASRAPQRVDLVLYYFREAEDQSFSTLVSLRQVFNGIPVLALSDKDDSDPEAAKGVLRHGAQGFISTRLVNLDMVVAAIRFIKAGGSAVAPREALFTSRTREPRHSQSVPTAPERRRRRRAKP